MVFSGLNFTSLYMLLAIKPPMSKLAALYNGESIHTGIKFLSFVALFIGWSKSLELLIHGHTRNEYQNAINIY